ncbi:MAG: DUF2442 domain-containing protein, partial [Anaerolineales bacterium]
LRSGAHSTNKSYCICGILMNSSNCLDWNSMNAPRIKAVVPLEERRLLVTFANGVQKIYDCRWLLNLDRFQLLKHDAFFKAVRVDPGGYGVSWSDEMDLSEDELWNNGVEIGRSTDKEIEADVISEVAKPPVCV